MSRCAAAPNAANPHPSLAEKHGAPVNRDGSETHEARDRWLRSDDSCLILRSSTCILYSSPHVLDLARSTLFPACIDVHRNEATAALLPVDLPLFPFCLSHLSPYRTHGSALGVYQKKTRSSKCADAVVCLSAPFCAQSWHARVFNPKQTKTKRWPRSRFYKKKKSSDPWR